MKISIKLTHSLLLLSLLGGGIAYAQEDGQSGGISLEQEDSRHSGQSSVQEDGDGQARAQKDKITVQLKGRLSLATENEDFGVKCDFLRLIVKGNLGDELSFLFRQRLNKAISSSDYMSATDYLYLSWIRNGWELSGGKYYVACGGMDYNDSSYDLFIRPVYFGGLAGMYNYVFNAARHFPNGERLCLQVSNSLYSSTFSDLLGYSIFLSGQQGIWEHTWSVNLFERSKGDYNQYVCLGNRFHTGPVGWDIGLVHRMDLRSPSLFKDFSAVTKLKWHAAEWINVFGKVTWDYKEDVPDPMLPDWTNTLQAGAGCEFFPFKDYKFIRLHCVYFNRGGDVNCVLAGISCSLDIYKK